MQRACDLICSNYTIAQTLDIQMVGQSEIHGPHAVGFLRTHPCLIWCYCAHVCASARMLLCVHAWVSVHVCVREHVCMYVSELYIPCCVVQFVS